MASTVSPEPGARRPARAGGLQAWRPRVRRWWLGKLSLSNTHTVPRRNLYLLPTRAGCMLGVTLLVLLVASINFQLNLGFLLTFMLTGAALVSIGVGYRNLLAMQLGLHAPQAAFVGQAVAVGLKLDNPARRARYALGVRLYDDTSYSMANVPAQGQYTVQLAMQASQRGLQPLPAVVVETRFPLGVFRMWTVFRSNEKALVYPSPESHPPPLPQGLADAGQGHSARLHASSGELDGVRGYRRGDPLKLVVWKKAASALATGVGPFVVRDSQQQSQQDLWLDAGRCGLAEREAQLSRLTAWVLQAEQQGLRYGLRIVANGSDIAPDSGPEHRAACLRALALA